MSVVGGAAGRRWAGLVLVLVLALQACGGSKATSDGPKDKASTATSETTAPRQDGQVEPGEGPGKEPGTSSSQTTTSTAAPTGGSNSTGTTPSKKDRDPEAHLPPLSITIELTTPCVTPGGTQTITIRTEPGSTAAYDTMYADGRSGAMPDHYGGNNGGEVDKDGVFRDTWVVKPNAPKGQAKVRVMAGRLDRKHAEGEAHFSVADVSGRCE